jgi:hypothetical protein
VLTVSTNLDPKREAASETIATEARSAYQQNGVAFACTLTRMMMLAEASFKFRNVKTKKLYGNTDLELLEYPWPGATAGELWARLEQQASLYGNAFVAKVASDELLILPADEVVIVSEWVTEGGVRYKRPIGYDWDPHRAPGVDSKATAQFFTIDEVAHKVLLFLEFLIQCRHVLLFHAFVQLEGPLFLLPPADTVCASLEQLLGNLATRGQVRCT